MKKFIILVLVVILGIECVRAQRIIRVSKWNSQRSYGFAEGERLTLKLKDTGEMLTGKWQYDEEEKLAVDTRATGQSRQMHRRTSESSTSSSNLPNIGK